MRIAHTPCVRGYLRYAAQNPLPVPHCPEIKHLDGNRMIGIIQRLEHRSLGTMTNLFQMVIMLQYIIRNFDSFKAGCQSIRVVCVFC